ncbi:MAG: oligoendopeptidase F [Blautia sp.]|jgi:oligoendopeptidase F
MSGKSGLPSRCEVAVEDCWNMKDLYLSDEVWETDAGKLEQRLEEFSRLQGVLSQNPDGMKKVLDHRQKLELLLERLYVYAGQKYHEDTGNAKYQQMTGRAEGLMTKTSDVLSFVEPELMEMEEERIWAFFEEEPSLSLYRRYVEEILRDKAHILSKELEQVLAKASVMAQGPQNIYSMFHNADLVFEEMEEEDGSKVEITHSRFLRLMESSSRSVRREAFEKVYQAYGQYRNTIAAVFDANVKQARFFSSMRNYGSTLQAALDGSRIPLSVYDRLIESVHKALPLMHRYVGLRKRALGLEELHMYDVYVPLTKEQKGNIPFTEAKELVKEGLAPLGREYQSILEEGFMGGWIDVYENKGKRSGAYSWGAYGTHPYVLLNYNGSFNHVFTLAHEMGHALHSYYSHREQPYLYAGYKIFVAEVASTCNESLLIHHLLEKAKDGQERAYLLNYFLEQCKSTIFRQTMFAEFERTVHERSAAGETLTAELLNDIYYRLNQEYFGPDMVCDPQIAWEWARIPHFYTPFYVYQYATGFSAAIAISRKLLAGEDQAVENYKKFLSGGSSMDCIELLKLCGVDMTTGEAMEQAMGMFEQYLAELEQLL